ncbi:MAG TPA: hypothetical protein VEQ15_09925 [Myxococcales bacterium]|nr:hypothetical protein [Myxococcales bacterium]
MLAVFLVTGLLLTAGRSGHADPFAGVSLKILNASAPPGGTMQLAVEVTEPIPIATGSAAIVLDTVVLGPLMGVALYGPAGAQSDAAGTAVVSGNRLRVRTVSPSSAFGTSTAAPILTVTMGVRADALPGAQASLVLDPAASFWLDPSGLPYPQQVRNGTFQVAGTVSIDDVIPGAGLLPAGSTVVVRGMGFQPGAIVEIDGVPLASAAVVSDTEVDATIGISADMYGRRVRVKNPDLSRASYHAYLRAAWLGRSARALLADTDPLFSPQTFTGAFFTASPGAGQFFGLALQNPAAAPADVTVELRSKDGTPIASAAVTLPARTRTSRELSELFAGQSMPAGGFLAVRSSSPVQMLGLLGDETAGTVEPVLASLVFP